MDLLITGASSGIARGLADEARRRGWRLARVCREAAVLDIDPSLTFSADVSTEDGARAPLEFATGSPGLTRTPMTARFLVNDASQRQVAAQYPLGRHGEVADAAALGAFLLSPEAGWITGQVVGLDGGFSAVRPAVRVS